MILIKISLIREKSGTVFIRTDQLDGETDWKLRLPINQTQRFLEQRNSEEILHMDWKIKAMKPTGEIYKFEGLFKNKSEKSNESLGLEQTLWANSVLASAQIIGLTVLLYYNIFTFFDRHSSLYW